MNPPGPIRWAQGMFLLPQHFQQSDLYHAAERGYLTNALLPFAWGVRSIDVAVEDLKQKSFRLRSCEAIFPDGTVFRLPGAAKVDAANFEGSLKSTMESIGVYLCLSEIDARKGAVDRYTVESVPLRDIFPAQSNGTARPPSGEVGNAEEERPIEHVVPRGKLLFTNDSNDGGLAGTQHLKIAVIRQTGQTDRPYVLSEEYVPPLVRCDASSALMRDLEGLFGNLIGLSNHLGRYRRGLAGIAYGAGDLLQLLALQVVNHMIPAMQHALNNGGGHPYFLYGALLQGRGALSTYCPEIEREPHNENSVVRYDHLDLGRCFRWLIDSIQAHIDLLQPTKREEIELHRDEQGIFFGEIREGLFSEASEFVMIITGPGTPEELRQRIERTAKVASNEKIYDAKDYHYPGLPFRYQEYPSPELPRVDGACYFALDTRHNDWKWLRDDSTFAFYSPEPDVGVKLFAVKPRGQTQ